MKLFRQLGIISIALIIVISTAGLSLIGCGGDSAGSSNLTPVAGDYEFSNLAQTAGSVTAVIVIPKTGAGARGAPPASNIRYAGQTAPPQTAGSYPVTFDVAAVTGWNGAIGLSAGNLTVSPAQAYGISLSQTGTYTFPAINVGSATPSAIPVTITNTGSQATGALTVSLSGSNTGSFTLSKSSIDSIAAGGTAASAFTFGPAASLGVGTYTATVNVTGGNGISASFNVSFTVNAGGSPSIYGINLLPSSNHTFTALTVGYSNAPAALQVSVSNSGNQPTGALTVALSGSNVGSFTLSPTSIPNIAVGATYSSFNVRPNIGLAEGTYTATVTVSGNSNITPKSFNVSFTVNAPGATPPVYRISLSQTGTYTFPAIHQGSTTLPPTLSVNVTNTGDQATGALTVELSGTSAGIFTLSTPSISSIAVGATTAGAFTVRPNDLTLAVGTYTAMVTVSGSNNIWASFNVSFTVAEALTYSITLSETGTYTFDAINEGDNVPSGLQVSVINTGTGATGALAAALSGTGADYFETSGTPVTSIAPNGIGRFTVRPKTTGVPHGTHTATVTVTGGNDISASFNLSFTVRQLPLNIRLDTVETVDFGARAGSYNSTNPFIPKTVTITNIGTQATGVNISIVGTDAASFTSSQSTIASIAPEGTGTFTVNPLTNLTTAQVYSATVFVVAGSIVKSFGVTCEFNTKFVPELSDYIISGSISQAFGAVTGITLTPRTGPGAKNNGVGAPPVPASNIKYDGNPLTSAGLPVGLYAITFDVDATGAYATDWNSVQGLSAGALTVTGSGLPQGSINTVWKDGTKEVTFGPETSTISTTPGSVDISVSGSGFVIGGWYLNGSLVQVSGNSYTFTRTASTRTGTHTVSVLLDIAGNLYKAESVITVQ